MKIGDRVEHINDPEYCGEIIGRTIGGGGWWVMDDRNSKGARPVTAETSQQMTPEVWDKINGRDVVVWHVLESKLRLVEASQDVAPAAVRQKPNGRSDHVAGISPETIDWSAHRAFFRGE